MLTVIAMYTTPINLHLIYRYYYQPFEQVKKQKLREVKQLAQGHRAKAQLGFEHNNCKLHSMCSRHPTPPISLSLWSHPTD